MLLSRECRWRMAFRGSLAGYIELAPSLALRRSGLGLGFEGQALVCACRSCLFPTLITTMTAGCMQGAI